MLLAVLALTATACASSSPGGAPSSPGDAPSSPGGASSQGACSLDVIYAIAGESSSADATRTATWTTIQANEWTAIVPSSDWTISASSAGGADIFSPDGDSAANLGDHDSQTPWTLTTLSQVALSSVSNINIICRGQVERSNGLTTQAVEFTGDYQNMQIHGIVVLSLLTPTIPDFFVGEIRSIYAPVSQWSTADEQTLWLIVKHAILVPQQ